MAFNKNKLRERKPMAQNFNTQKVVDYVSKVDYFKYTHDQAEVKTLRECEQKIAYASGKIKELNMERWNALLTMRGILKKDGEFGEVMRALGISKDMVYEINLREKIYIKYDVKREDIASLPVRAVKELAKKDYSQIQVAEIVKEPAKIKEYAKPTPKKDKAISIQEELERLEAEKEELLKKKKEINERLKEIDARIAVIRR